MQLRKPMTALLSTGLLTFALVGVVGCDDKEEVLDIETPGGEVEVERDRDTGAVEIDADDNE